MAYCGPRGIPLSAFLSWTPDDQAAALAWQADDAARCPNCHTAEWEWEEDGLGAWVAETRVCAGCMKVAQAHQDAEQQRKAIGGGVQVYLRRGAGADG